MKSLIAMALLSSAFYAKPATEKSNAAGGNKAAATPAPAPAAEDGGKSIINPKYRDKYKDPDYKPDFVADMIDDAALTKDDKGKSQGLNQSLMLDLAAKNGVSEADLKNLRASVGTKNAGGRIKMTVANMLRARAKRRHSLMDLQGKVHKVPSDFVVGEKTENDDGSKIEKPKAPAPAPAKDETAGNGAAAAKGAAAADKKVATAKK